MCVEDIIPLGTMSLISSTQQAVTIHIQTLYAVVGNNNMNNSPSDDAVDDIIMLIHGWSMIVRGLEMNVHVYTA